MTGKIEIPDALFREEVEEEMKKINTQTTLDRYIHSDEGNAQYFVENNRDNILYETKSEKWYIWNDRFWKLDENLNILRIARDSMIKKHKLSMMCSMLLGKELEGCNIGDDNPDIKIIQSKIKGLIKWGLESTNEDRIKKVLNLSRSDVSITQKYLDKNPELINLKNGTYNLRTFELQEFSRGDILTKMSNIEYDPDATCPCWDQHLKLVFKDNTDLINSFQEMCGYSLLSGNPEQKLFFLYGSGENGKSVTLQVLHDMLGEYSATVAPESLMVKNNIGGARSDIARLVGMRLVTASEGETNNKLAEAMIKQLTGNETITVRRLYQEEFEFEPEFTIWFATNHLPIIKGTDHAIWRRIWLIPFDVKIPQERKIVCYDKILMSESSGIFNWMMEGLKRYKKNGKLTEPDIILKKTNEYKDDSNNVLKFFNTYYKFDALTSVVKSEFYDSYRRWCTEEGEEVNSQKAVTKILQEMGIFDGKKDGKGYKPYKGIRLKTSAELTADEVSGSVQSPILN